MEYHHRLHSVLFEEHSVVLAIRLLVILFLELLIQTHEKCVHHQLDDIESLREVFVQALRQEITCRLIQFGGIDCLLNVEFAHISFNSFFVLEQFSACEHFKHNAPKGPDVAKSRVDLGLF